jgi:hypothetical protein
MQAADVPQSDAHAESPPNYIPPPPDFPPRADFPPPPMASEPTMRPLPEVCAKCAKLQEDKKTLEEDKKKLEKDKKKLEEDKKKLEQRTKKMEKRIEDLELDRKHIRYTFQRLHNGCQKGIKKSSCRQCIKGASITGFILEKKEKEDMPLHMVSDVHPIAEAPNGWYFCTTCRGLQGSPTRNDLDERWFAQFHRPTIAYASYANQQDLLSREFNQQSVANQTNGLKQGS